MARYPRWVPIPRRPVLARRALAAALVGAALTGCGTVRVPSGPAADDPACAPVVIGAPDQMLGQQRHETSSQGTVAWGQGENAVVLRCGVTPPGPTTEACTRIESPDGVQVDWIVHEKAGIVTFTTYGRSPAIEVSVPRSVAPDQPSAAVLELAGPVSQIPATTQCVGPGDVA